MAKKSREDSLEGVKNSVDKEFNEWRQPVTPESPSPQDPREEIHSETISKSAVCGIKDLSRLSRKRRTQNGRICSRKRSEEKSFSSTLETKPRLSRKEPLPMRLRSLPQSFFQQPNSIKSSSMAQNTYSRLPPLFPRDHNPDEETTERPVTPPEERQQPQPKPQKRVITSPPDTELLNSLFKSVTPNHLEKKLVRRGRPKKVNAKVPLPKPPNHEEDPCMVENLARKILPQLSLKNRCKLSSNVRLATISFGSGNNSVELPTLAVENNYSQMLSELVMNM